jgi:mono/diheme cytochrome c family protein
VKYGWLVRWIADPKSMRPQSHMPRVFANLSKEEADQNARDIAAFLAPPRPSPDDGKGIPCEDGDKGARLFVDLGCIACHTAPDAKAPDPARIPLNNIGEKFHYTPLKQYLLKPQAHYPWTRMPDFHLSDREAHLLAVYLKVTSPVPPSDPPPGDPARGKQLLGSAGCLACHAPLASVANQSAPPALSKIHSGNCKAVDFNLKDDELSALQAFVSSGFNSLNIDLPAEFAERAITQLNCTACHARDKQDDRWSGLTEEISRFPKSPDTEFPDPEGDQSRPPLTWAGEKLRPQWMTEFLAGHVTYKPRPWLTARMPSFESRATLLAEGLAAQHGCPPVAAAHETQDPQLTPIGKKLIARDGGFACIQCHAAGEMKALSPFEAPAINFAYVSDRLNKEFYDRWVYNPQRVLPGTRMPSFAVLSGKTALKDIFDGDARKQFDAIWHYLLAGQTIQPPQ